MKSQFTIPNEQDTILPYPSINGKVKKLYYHPLMEIPTFYTLLIGIKEDNKPYLITLSTVPTDTQTIKNSTIFPLNLNIELITGPEILKYDNSYKYYSFYCDTKNVIKGLEYEYDKNSNTPLSFTQKSLPNITIHNTPVINLFSFSHNYTKEKSFFDRIFKQESKKYTTIGIISSSEYQSLKRTMFYLEENTGQRIHSIGNTSQKITDSTVGYTALAVHKNKLLYCKPNDYPDGIFDGIARESRYKNNLNAQSFCTIYLNDIATNNHSFSPLSKGTILDSKININYKKLPLAALSEQYAVILNQKQDFHYEYFIYTIAEKKSAPKEIKVQSEIFSPIYIIENTLICFTQKQIIFHDCNSNTDPTIKDLSTLLPSNITKITAVTYNFTDNIFYMATEDKENPNKSTIFQIHLKKILE